VAPGSFVAIYGSNFATGFTAAAALPLPSTLGDVIVLFNGIPDPLVAVGHFAGTDQINAQVPWEVQPPTAQVIVMRGGLATSPMTIPITTAAPGLLYIATDSAGVNRPLVYNNSDNTFSYPVRVFGDSLNSRPAKVGEILILLCTGLGPVTVTPADGTPATKNGQFVESDTLTTPVVLVGGVPANVAFSGLSQFPALYQINFTLATGTPAGDTVPIQIQMNGITTTDQLKIAVSN
jgi:uncharacterized protein (TIGR03437 family)